MCVGRIRQGYQGGQKQPYQFEWDKLHGNFKYSKQFDNAKFTGGRQKTSQTLQELEHQPEKLTNRFSEDFIQKVIEMNDKQKCGGGTLHGDSVLSLESLLLKTLLIKDSEKTIDNLRVQRLMGINSLDGKVTMETIPDKPNRSQYSCERYQFFLDAPFNIGKQCCDVMKKSPLKKYQKDTGRKPILATMASESRLRTQVWLAQGCNAFDAKDKKSAPMSFWFEQDVLQYIYINDLPLNPVYGKIAVDYEGMGEVDGQMSLADLSSEFGVFDLKRPTYKTTGCQRTGCFACGFGMHREKPENSRIQNIIDFSNPKLADWMLRGGHFRESDGLWEPHNGCGMWFVMEWCNIHGGMKYWYPNREYYLEKYMTDETRYYLYGETKD